MTDVTREDRFCPIDEEEGHFAGRLGLELIEPAFAAGGELFVEASCLEAHGVGTLGLAITSRVSHRGVADLHADVGVVCRIESMPKRG